MKYRLLKLEKLDKLTLDEVKEELKDWEFSINTWKKGMHATLSQEVYDDFEQVIKVYEPRIKQLREYYKQRCSIEKEVKNENRYY